MHHIWQTQTFITKMWGAAMKHVIPADTECCSCDLWYVRCPIDIHAVNCVCLELHPNVCYFPVESGVYFSFFTYMQLRKCGILLHVCEGGSCCWIVREHRRSGQKLTHSQPQMFQLISRLFMVQAFIEFMCFKIDFRLLVNKWSM